MNFNLSQASQNLPASLLRDQEVLPRNRPPRLLSAQAFAPTLESSFSGITYHLAQAGLSNGCLEGCFSLYSGEKPLRSLQIRGATWKATRLLQRQKTSGFKFTSDYLEQVWPKYIRLLDGSTLISNFQLYGRTFVKKRKELGIGAYYYIDGTLSEYFESYADFDVASIGPATRRGTRWNWNGRVTIRRMASLLSAV